MRALLAIIALVALATGAQADTAADINKAWKLDVSNINIDPSTWREDFKAKMMKVGAGMGYASTLSMPLTHVIIFGVFLFGLVKLNWLLVGSACMALYGWKTGKRTFLVVGAVATYALAYGVALF